MNKIGKINICNMKYTVNIDDRVQESMYLKDIGENTVISSIIKVCDQLDENVGDDMFIKNEDEKFILVASIEKQEVNIIALVLEENVIIKDGISLI